MATAPLFMGGMFNYSDPLLNQPLYVYLWLFLIALSVLCWLGYRYGRWKSFEAMHGLYYAYKSGSQAAFVFNTGLVAELIQNAKPNAFSIMRNGVTKDYRKYRRSCSTTPQSFCRNWILPMHSFTNSEEGT